MTVDELIEFLEKDDHIFLPKGVEFIHSELEDGGRWYNWAYYTYQMGDKFVQSCRKVGSTEHQEVDPEDRGIEVYEVRQVPSFSYEKV